MKTAFSTLVCPNWSFNEILSSAIDLGYNGIEFRGVEKEINTVAVEQFLPQNIEITKERFKKAGIQIPMFTSGAVLSEESQSEIKQAYQYADLCANFNGNYIRVLADKTPYPKNRIDENLLLKNLDNICGYAGEKGVNVCIETNGAYSASADILRILKSVKQNNLFVIWDIHHSYRYGREKPKYTFSMLRDYICHVHIKDSVISGGKIEYKLPGDGDVPLKEALYELYKSGYQGFLCLEWVKRWVSGLAEPGIALPAFLFYIKDVLQSL